MAKGLMMMGQMQTEYVTALPCARRLQSRRLDNLLACICLRLDRSAYNAQSLSQ